MNILILVLSHKDPPYDLLHEAQKRTWDSVEVDGIDTRYYYPTAMDDMLWALKISLDEVWDEDWNFIFRTNSSSYVDKQALLNFAEKLPKEKCYCGLDGGGFASGSGMFWSRDVVKILRNEITDKKTDLADDEMIGRILSEHGIGVTPGAKRYDYYYEEFVKQFYHHSQNEVQNDVLEHYHYRCKSDTNDRQKDVKAMEVIHQLKTGDRK